MNDSPSVKDRKIRSFVLRSGRMTESQRKAFESHMARWSLPADKQSGAYDFAALYGNDNPVVLEIGFGMGDSLFEMAAAAPNTNFLGIEVHRAGVGRLLRLVEEKGLQNLRVVCDDAVEVIDRHIPAKSLQRVNIYFPDPWHKKRHHKRRLIQSEFLTLLHSRIKPDGLLHIATDWVPYAEHVLECIEDNGLFTNAEQSGPFVKPANYGRPETKFERRGKHLQHEVRDMVFTPKRAG